MMILMIMLIAVSVFAGGQQESVASKTGPLELSFAKLGNDNEFDNQRPAAHHLMDLLTEYSDGRITFKYFPSGNLGSEADMLDQVITGDLDMAMLSDGTFASVTPEASMALLPFLFNSSEEFYAVASIESGSEYEKALVEAVDDYGLFKFIAPLNGLFRGFNNRKQRVDSFDDMKNINMRIQPGEIFTDSYAAVGTSTATIAFSELYTSLQQGAIDGEDVSHPFFYAYGFTEVEPYTTELRMFFQTINLIVSNDCWNNKFTEEDRDMFMRAAEEAQRLGFLDQYVMDEKVLKLLDEKPTVELVRFSDISEKDKALFQNAVKPVWEKHSKVNSKVWTALQSSLTAYR